MYKVDIKMIGSEGGELRVLFLQIFWFLESFYAKGYIYVYICGFLLQMVFEVDPTPAEWYLKLKVNQRSPWIGSRKSMWSCRQSFIKKLLCSDVLHMWVHKSN